MCVVDVLVVGGSGLGVFVTTLPTVFFTSDIRCGLAGGDGK